MKFQKGQSGNPAGRPPGLRSELRELLMPHADGLVAKAVEKALEGDSTALRICLDRLIPPIKARDDHVAMEPFSGGLADQGRTILEGISSGTLTPDQAATLLQALSSQARIVEVDELERRIAALETAKVKT
jgi:hypothetical protein